MTELSRIALESVRMLLQSALNIVLLYHVDYAFDAAQRRFPYFPCGLGAVAERLSVGGFHGGVEAAPEHDAGDERSDLAA